MPSYIMALDAGTTSNRCILFNEHGEMCSVSQREFTQIFPKPGWVEHDANEIWATQLGVAVEAMQKIGATAADIAAIGITNQRETAIVWDKKTGEPVYHAIVWQCRRTSEYCDSLKEKGLTDTFRAKTGLVIDAYFSGTKIRWILENVPGVRERAQRGELLFGTVETWLIWKLTGGKVHVTDYSNASRTMLFNINTLQWDDEILAELDIPKCMLPTPMPSSCVYGETDPSLLGGPIKIGGAAGDQQSALFGQASGASFNPALTIALAVGGMFDWALVPGYVIAQILGGIAGGILVYILFKDQFDATDDPGTKLGVFSTGPSIPNTGRNILQEAIATFVLVFAICGLNQVPELNAGVGKLLVFGIIVSIGMSLGGLTGYALNPARDLGPRIAHAILPIKGKGDSNFKYGLVVPIVGPILGGIVAVLLYNAIPW